MHKQSQTLVEQKLTASAVFERVREALIQVDPRIARRPLTTDLSLIDDLGFDSLRLVDLAFSLEAELQLNEFPVQRWADGEADSSGKRFTIASLVEICLTCLNEEAARR